MEHLRLLYKNGDGGTPISADLRSHRVFLVADDEILSDADASTVKCVEADYKASNHIGTARVPQRYFGWIHLVSEDVLGLWKELEVHDLETLAPQMIEGSSPKIWKSVGF
jgi:hypothetical protein